MIIDIHILTMIIKKPMTNAGPDFAQTSLIVFIMKHPRDSTTARYYSCWSFALLVKICFYGSYLKTSSLAKGYDPLYSTSPLASLDGFS